MRQVAGLDDPADRNDPRPGGAEGMPQCTIRHQAVLLGCHVARQVAGRCQHHVFFVVLVGPAQRRTVSMHDLGDLFHEATRQRLQRSGGGYQRGKPYSASSRDIRFSLGGFSATLPSRLRYIDPRCPACH